MKRLRKIRRNSGLVCKSVFNGENFTLLQAMDGTECYAPGILVPEGRMVLCKVKTLFDEAGKRTKVSVLSEIAA